LSFWNCSIAGFIFPSPPRPSRKPVEDEIMKKLNLILTGFVATLWMFMGMDVPFDRVTFLKSAVYLIEPTSRE
jgi:hypothetical protein